MDEQQAHAHQREMQARGAGAALQQHGPGFSGAHPPVGPRPLGPPFRPPFMPPPHFRPFLGMRPPFMPPGGRMRPPFMPPPGMMHPPFMPHPFHPGMMRPPHGPPPPFGGGGPQPPPFGGAPWLKAGAQAGSQNVEHQRRVRAAWAAYRDPAGDIYYANSLTGEATWQRPADLPEGAAAEPGAAPTPVSSARVAGTDWLEVRTDDGKTFWHNEGSGDSTWEAPPEVAAAQRIASKLDPAKMAMLERAKRSGAQVAPEFVMPRESSGARAEQGLAAEDEDVTFTEEDIGGAAPQPQPPPPEQPAHAGAAAEGAEAWAPPLPPPPPSEPHPDDATAAFKALLRDKGVHAFSRWEKELPKLQPDPRFRAVPQAQRRQAFEDYCSEVGQAKKKNGTAGAAPAAASAGGKGAAGAAAAKPAKAERSADEAFRALLRERGVKAGASWPDTLDLLAKEPRCSALPAARAKAVFRDHVAALQRAEQGREEAERRARAERRAGEERQRMAGAAAAMANYRTLLSEAVQDPAASWEDWRSRLERDPQSRGPGPHNPLLDPGAAEAAFRSHAAALLDAATSSFVELLEERLGPIVPSAAEEAARGGLPRALSAWEDAEAVLQEEGRLQRMPAALREGVWRQFVEDAMWNRDHPGEERRTLRRPPRREGGGGAGSAAAADVKDRAYDREYLEVDRKRIRRE